jgi:hypothetical protein
MQNILRPLRCSAYQSQRAFEPCPSGNSRLEWGSDWRLVEPVHDFLDRFDHGDASAFAKPDPGTVLDRRDKGDLCRVDDCGNPIGAGELDEHYALPSMRDKRNRFAVRYQPRKFDEGLEWVEPGFRPKAPPERPKQDPEGKVRSQATRPTYCGSGIKAMVPQKELEPPTPTLRKPGQW